MPQLDPVSNDFIRNNVKMSDFNTLYNDKSENKYYVGDDNDYTSYFEKIT